MNLCAVVIKTLVVGLCGVNSGSFLFGSRQRITFLEYAISIAVAKFFCVVVVCFCQRRAGGRASIYRQRFVLSGNM